MEISERATQLVICGLEREHCSHCVDNIPETIYPFVYIWVHNKNKQQLSRHEVEYSDQKVAN